MARFTATSARRIVRSSTLPWRATLPSALATMGSRTVARTVLRTMNTTVLRAAQTFTLTVSCARRPYCGQGQHTSPQSATQRRSCHACPANTYQPTSHRQTVCLAQPTCVCGTKNFDGLEESKAVAAAVMHTRIKTPRATVSNLARATAQRGEKISADSKTSARKCSACNAHTYQDSTQHRNMA